MSKIFRTTAKAKRRCSLGPAIFISILDGDASKLASTKAWQDSKLNTAPVRQRSLPAI